MPSVAAFVSAYLALVLAAVPAAAQDLAQLYPATLERDASDPEPLDWVCEPRDVWRLSQFEFAFEKRLKIKLRASTLVLGRHAGNAIWAVVLPDRPAKLRSTLGGGGEKIEHVWMRFHPSRVGELFPERTLRGQGPPEARLAAYRVYEHKHDSFWSTGYEEPEGGAPRALFDGERPVLPPRGVVVLDMDTEGGRRRAFSVDTDEGQARLLGQFLTRPVGAAPEVARKEAMQAFDQACTVARNLRDAGLAAQGVEWDEHEKSCRKGISRVRDGYALAASIYELLRPLDPTCLRLEVGRERVPAVAWDRRPGNASRGGVRRILDGLETTDSRQIEHGRTKYGIGYVRVRKLTEEAVLEELDQVLEGLADTWGLMLDLRFGMRGVESLVTRMAGRFVAEETPYAKHVVWSEGTDDVRELTVEPRGEWPYGGFVYALVGSRTAGEAERLALVVRALPKGVLFGEPTAGEGLGADWSVLAEGLSLFHRSGRTLDVEGNPLPPDGLVPDELVTVDELEFTPRADPVLYRALEHVYLVPHEERLTAKTGEPWPWPDELTPATGEASQAGDGGGEEEGGTRAPDAVRRPPPRHPAPARMGTAKQKPETGSRGQPAAEVAPLPQEVLERLPVRDPVALEAFFDAFFGRVYGYVRRLVGDDHLAEDLTQDIFLHVHRALPTYDPARDVRPWVFTIATNKVRDHWRSRRHRDSLTEESVERDRSAAHVSAGARPEVGLSAEELAQAVRAAIEDLPEGMRVTVHLRLYEGLSFEEVGAILERSEVAVRKRYSRALELLREVLGPAYRMHVEEGG